VTLELAARILSWCRPTPTSSARRRASRRLHDQRRQVCIVDYVFVPDDRMDSFVDVARQTLRGMFGSIVSTMILLFGQPRQLRQGRRLIDDARSTVPPSRPSLPLGSHSLTRHPQDRANDRARHRRAHEDCQTKRSRSGPGGQALLATDRRHRLHQQAARTLVAYGTVRQPTISRTRSHTRSGEWRAMTSAPDDSVAAPFGVSAERIGAYHGKAGFDAFSHYRPWWAAICRSASQAAAPPFSGR